MLLKEGIELFGLDYRTMLARDIIDSLDNTDEALSVEKIQQKIGRGSSVTINDVCKNLMKLIEIEYGDKEYSVELTTGKKGGYHLERHNTNLQNLYKSIFETDLSYLILMHAIQYREFSTYDFCSKYHVSFSTVQRKIKAINTAIETFQVRLTCSKKVKFNSEEIMVRSFSYLFFWSIHREISNTLFFSDYDFYIDIATKIIEHLNKTYDPVKVRSIALWVKLFSVGISKEAHVSLEKEKEELIRSFKIPCQPDFLDSWDTIDWYLLVGIIDVTGIYPFEIEFSVDKMNIFIDKDALSVEKFINVSQKHFHYLEADKILSVQNMIHRYQLLNIFIHPTTKSELKSITRHILGFKSVREINPLYWKKFASFWKELKTDLRQDEQHTYLRYICLMICLEVYPINSCRPIFKVHITSDFDVFYENMLKQILCAHFDSLYQIKFVENFFDAQLIITTTPLEKELYNDNQLHLLIHSQLTSKDLDKIKAIFDSLSNLQNISATQSDNF